MKEGSKGKSNRRDRRGVSSNILEFARVCVALVQSMLSVSRPFAANGADRQAQHKSQVNQRLSLDSLETKVETKEIIRNHYPLHISFPKAIMPRDPKHQ
ncbi:hypothetical protein FT663_04027 [Candidozyma haemuli var. vulneris]|nr:hypothetical protein FT662_04091 [[Candida] haemuloni var. vulneris]KAF3988489.1 hypothetical protein FT663_04027 [[Candida] haemuloni var. vulneris]